MEARLTEELVFGESCEPTRPNTRGCKLDGPIFRHGGAE